MGSFKDETILPLIEKYIASLPANGKKTYFVDNKVRAVKGNKLLEIKNMETQRLDNYETVGFIAIFFTILAILVVFQVNHTPAKQPNP